MPAANAPKGKTVCPRVSIRCARALVRFLSVSIKCHGELHDEAPLSDERVVASFLHNLKKEVRWFDEESAHSRIAAAEKRDNELKRLIKEQSDDMKGVSDEADYTA
jgi:hypothetical protein